jgi:hypothetical protein
VLVLVLEIPLLTMEPVLTVMRTVSIVLGLLMEIALNASHLCSFLMENVISDALITSLEILYDIASLAEMTVLPAKT